MFDIRSLTWSFLLLLWGLSDRRIAELREMRRCFSIKLHSETQVSGRLGMYGGRSPRHAQNPLSVINWLQRFYRTTMSLKRPFVPKNDVKQWYTTTLRSETYIGISPYRTPCSVFHYETYIGISPYYTFAWTAMYGSYVICDLIVWENTNTVKYSTHKRVLHFPISHSKWTLFAYRLSGVVR